MSMTTHQDGSTRSRKAAVWLLTIVVALVTVVPVAAAAPASAGCSTGALLGNTTAVDTIEAVAQQRFVSRLNDLRRSRGKSSLAWNGALATPAIGWSQKMSAQDWLRHARTQYGATLQEDYVEIGKRVVPNWQRLAENVGQASMSGSCTLLDLESNALATADRLHTAFVNSSGHLANMVGDHNQVGIGVHIDHAKMWVTVRFAKGDLPTGSNAVAYTPVSEQTLRYIDGAYAVFARRSANSTEKAHWGPIVQSGNRLALTTALARGESWAGQMLDELYRTVLGRKADAGGKAYWMDQIARGYPLEKAAVEFYGSSEYFTSRGGTNTSFLHGLYKDLLHRTADSSGMSYWKPLLDRGRLTRSGVAWSSYQGIESRRDRVVTVHERIFGYGISGSARDAWANRLAKVGDVAVAAELAATDTFWSAATR